VKICLEINANIHIHLVQNFCLVVDIYKHDDAGKF
jgi:hypothetical protein